jgi:multidrug efflux pump subunit AcrA (membrane-fusion protein)
MNTIRALIFLALIATVFAACKQRRLDGGEEAESNTPPVVTVKIFHVRQCNLEEHVDATGRMEVLRRQKVISPVTGTLLSIKVLEGTSVRQNEELLAIRPKEAQTAIAGAEELLHIARTEAERREAQAALDLARSTQNVVIVRAGFNGVVATRSVTEGELVTENAELMTVVDLSTIIFVAEVPLQDAPRIRKGQRAMLEFQPLPGQHYAALVDAVYPGSELQSQTVGVRLQLTRVGEEARQLLKPSMMGVCRIVTGVHKNVLIVPRIALLRNDERNLSSVVVVTPDSIARVLPVSVGVSTDSTVEVKGPGLGVGTPVVVEGNYALPDSTRVRW